ncbi:MAG: hypothetical protein SX243_10170 [Acidobacteriota bacterium]|nr:hypothetical protein [Acidobacteriota bacterium]
MDILIRVFVYGLVALLPYEDDQLDVAILKSGVCPHTPVFAAIATDCVDSNNGREGCYSGDPDSFNPLYAAVYLNFEGYQIEVEGVSGSVSFQSSSQLKTSKSPKAGKEARDSRWLLSMKSLLDVGGLDRDRISSTLSLAGGVVSVCSLTTLYEPCPEDPARVCDDDRAPVFHIYRPSDKGKAKQVLADLAVWQNTVAGNKVLIKVRGVEDSVPWERSIKLDPYPCNHGNKKRCLDIFFGAPQRPDLEGSGSCYPDDGDHMASHFRPYYSLYGIPGNEGFVPKTTWWSRWTARTAHGDCSALGDWLLPNEDIVTGEEGSDVSSVNACPIVRGG